MQFFFTDNISQLFQNLSAIIAKKSEEIFVFVYIQLLCYSASYFTKQSFYFCKSNNSDVFLVILTHSILFFSIHQHTAIFRALDFLSSYIIAKIKRFYLFPLDNSSRFDKLPVFSVVSVLAGQQ